MKKSILSLLLSALFTSVSLSAQSKLQGNGKVVTDTRTTGDYDGIRISGFFDVNLVAGKEGKITIKGEENLLSAIKVEVEDNSLKIYIEKSTNIRTSSGKNIQITVPFQKISELSLAGSGDIQSKDVIKNDKFSVRLSGSGNFTLPVDTSNLELNVSGSGNVRLKGTANHFSAKLSGSGDIDAGDLKSKIVEANVSGSGNSKVACEDSLTARVSGSGNIRYVGNPEIRDTKVSGSGNISKS